jgi:hypothetical protein
LDKPIISEKGESPGTLPDEAPIPIAIVKNKVPKIDEVMPIA